MKIKLSLESQAFFGQCTLREVLADVVYAASLVGEAINLSTISQGCQ